MFQESNNAKWLDWPLLYVPASLVWLFSHILYNSKKKKELQSCNRSTKNTFWLSAICLVDLQHFKAIAMTTNQRLVFVQKQVYFPMRNSFVTSLFLINLLLWTHLFTTLHQCTCKPSRQKRKPERILDHFFAVCILLVWNLDLGRSTYTPTHPFSDSSRPMLELLNTDLFSLSLILSFTLFIFFLLIFYSFQLVAIALEITAEQGVPYSGDSKDTLSSQPTEWDETILSNFTIKLNTTKLFIWYMKYFFFFPIEY